MAVSAEEVGTEDAAIVSERRHGESSVVGLAPGCGAQEPPQEPGGTPALPPNLTSRIKRVERCRCIIQTDGSSGHDQIRSRVDSIGQECIAVLEQAHRPA